MSAGAGPERAPSASDAPRITHALHAALGVDLAAVVFFGSRYLGTSPNATSACDLFVVVRDYVGFYRAQVPGLARPPSSRFLAGLNRILPPNIFSYDDGEGAGAKCFVISERDLARALRGRSPDHFVKGRLTQNVTVMHARDEAERSRVTFLLQEARRSALDWVPSFFSGEERERPFDVQEFCLRMLEVSYAYEIRPEPAARVREVRDAQRAFFAHAYGLVLDEGVQGGRLERLDERFRLRKPPGAMTRLGWKMYFRRSKVRATLRWLKYTFTYVDWLDYLIRKVERRTGLTVEVTPIERRLPFLLLWPKVFRVLRERRSVVEPGHRR